MTEPRSRLLVGLMGVVPLLIANAIGGVLALFAQSGAEKVFELSQDIKSPALVREARPRYTNEARNFQKPPAMNRFFPGE